MKKLWAAAAAVVLCAVLLVPCAGASRGDVDLNGRIEAADARLALRLAVGLDDGLSEESRASADADQNGRVNAADARMILRVSVGLGTLEDDPAAQEDLKELSSKEVYQLASAFTFEIRSKSASALAIGTGFAVAEDGQIVTNYHVIEDAKVINVLDGDGNAYPVQQVLAFDREKDLAVLKIDKTLTPAVLCKSGYETGDSIYTLGSSSGYTGTFSYGVISNASVRVEEYSRDMTYIQISAPISPGNSGGPLLDVYGRVIGVNTFSDEAGQNLNFSVPVFYLDQLENVTPMTLSAFAEAEQNRKTLELYLGDDELHLRVGGTAALVFKPFSRQTITLACESSSDCLKTTLSYRKNAEFAWVYICAVGNCPDAVVTVYIKEAPEIRREIRVRVSPQGNLSYAGAGAPDFGAMTGIAPDRLINDPSLVYPEMDYDGGALQRAGHSAESLRERYFAALEEAGFTLQDSASVLFGTNSEYVFLNADTGVQVNYFEKKIFQKIQRVGIQVIY